jgi:hypothetical protein
LCQGALRCVSRLEFPPWESGYIGSGWGHTALRLTSKRSQSFFAVMGEANGPER